MAEIEIFDTTLRDGNQGLGIGFTVLDKLDILRTLDSLGFARYIEGGWPGSNPKDLEFFAEAKKVQLGYSKLVVFGSTRHPANTCENDPSMQSTIKSGAKTAAIFGKSWDRHVRNQLRVSLPEGLHLIEDSVRYLACHPQIEEVIYDAEHFFDGFKNNREFAMESIQRARDAGAKRIVLCETNGGATPEEVAEITRYVKSKFPDIKIGIHGHNDGGLATANTRAAVGAGAEHVQGTINGFGERTGNADLIEIIPWLQYRMGYKCIPEESLGQLKNLSKKLYELANLQPDPRQPFVGDSSATHKAGVHADATLKDPGAYQAFDLAQFGNQIQIVASDQSGRANIRYKIQKLGLQNAIGEEHIRPILNELKTRENRGYSYEVADASLKMLMLEVAGLYDPPFYLESVETKSGQQFDYSRQRLREPMVRATICVRIGKTGQLSASVGDDTGDFQALETAIKYNFHKPFPNIEDIRLLEYKARSLPAKPWETPMFRVLGRFGCDDNIISTVGVGTSMLQANLGALFDAYHAVLYEHGYGTKR